MGFIGIVLSDKRISERQPPPDLAQRASGSSGKKVKSRKQAIAIGLSEARREGKKVPPKPSPRGKRSSRRRKAR